MGVVYKAEGVALSRLVAVKRIASSLANDESFLRRFRSEAQALARIDSPYIVSVHAVRQTEIGLLIVMEYVNGGTLRDVMDARPIGGRPCR
jgi:serine/threonine protein kinase